MSNDVETENTDLRKKERQLSAHVLPLEGGAMQTHLATDNWQEK